MVNSMVVRATSSQLIGSDWAMNLEICDRLNHEPGQAKDVVKGIKKRLGSRNPKVQLLVLTLLETVVKNCGDVVHMHVAEKDIPHEMVKITKKKPDFQVKEKILTLIDTWQEAFGGPRARYPQYYAAYQELLRAGAVFPRKSESSAPVFTPPQTQPLSSYPPNLRHISTRGETAEASSDAEYSSLSLTEIQNARGIMDVLAEMLSAIDPANKQSLRQEVIVDLVEQCRTYKQRVVHLVNSTSDESLLCQGLALNDDLQKVLAKHEALVSGTTVPQDKSKPESSKSIVDANAPLVETGESSKQAEARSPTGGTIPAPPVNGSIATPAPKAEPKLDLLSGDLLGDDFSSVAPQDALALVPVSAPQPSSPVANQQNALALIDMFSTPSSSNSHPPGPAGHTYPGAPQFQQQQNLQLPESSMPYANEMATNMGLPQYEQSGGYLQAGGGGWNPQVAQQQPQSLSPAGFGAFNAQVAQQQPQSPSPAAYRAFNAQVAQQQQQQPQSLAYGALNAQVVQQSPQQQQPQSPVYGALNGGAFPPPPWESQPAEMNHLFSPSHSQPFTPNQPFSPSHSQSFTPNQPFSPSHSQSFTPNQPFSPIHSQSFTHNQPFSPQYSPAMSMGGQQSLSFQGGIHPFAPQSTGNDHQVPGMYAQQQMTGGHMPGMNAQHMPNQMSGIYPQPYQGGSGPMMGMGPQAMQATQMAQMYGNQMPGYGYGYGYAQQQQPNPQYLDQRMYGLSLRDDSSLKLGSSQSSMASYLPPMKQQPKGDDKLFGDLVDMAKLRPSKSTTPNRTGSV